MPEEELQADASEGVEGFSELDLLAEIASMVDIPPEREPGEVTTREMAEQWGVDPETARKKLNGLVKAGKLTRRKVRIAGFGTAVMAYRKCK